MAGKERYPERNAMIRQQRAEGWKLVAIAAHHGLSASAVYAVLNPAAHQARFRKLRLRNGYVECPCCGRFNRPKAAS